MKATNLRPWLVNKSHPLYWSIMPPTSNISSMGFSVIGWDKHELSALLNHLFICQRKHRIKEAERYNIQYLPMLLCDLVFQICFNSSGTTLNLTGILRGLSNILWEKKYDLCLLKQSCFSNVFFFVHPVFVVSSLNVMSSLLWNIIVRERLDWWQWYMRQ